MDVATFISNVGFPIAACVFLAYHSMQTEKMHKENIKVLEDNHKKEVEVLSKSVDNNTEALKELTSQIRGRKP